MHNEAGRCKNRETERPNTKSFCTTLISFFSFFLYIYIFIFFTIFQLSMRPHAPTHDLPCACAWMAASESHAPTNFFRLRHIGASKVLHHGDLLSQSIRLALLDARKDDRTTLNQRVKASAEATASFLRRASNPYQRPPKNTKFSRKLPLGLGRKSPLILSLNSSKIRSNLKLPFAKPLAKP